jgi:hypothetical protein
MFVSQTGEVLRDDSHPVIKLARIHCISRSKILYLSRGSYPACTRVNLLKKIFAADVQYGSHLLSFLWS